MKTNIKVLQKQIETTLFGNKTTLEIIERYLGVVSADEIVSAGLESLISRVERQKARERHTNAFPKTTSNEEPKLCREAAIRDAVKAQSFNTWDELHLYVVDRHPYLAPSMLSIEKNDNTIRSSCYFWRDRLLHDIDKRLHVDGFGNIIRED